MRLRVRSEIESFGVNKALITATDEAPEPITAGAFDSVIPPIATIGRPEAIAATDRSPSKPTIGSVSVFVLVAKIGPIAR